MVDHSDCEYNTKEHNGYISISHAACQAAWDITTYPMLLVTRHMISHHITCCVQGWRWCLCWLVAASAGVGAGGGGDGGGAAAAAADAAAAAATADAAATAATAAVTTTTTIAAAAAAATTNYYYYY